MCPFLRQKTYLYEINTGYFYSHLNSTILCFDKSGIDYICMKSLIDNQRHIVRSLALLIKLDHHIHLRELNFYNNLYM